MNENRKYRILSIEAEKLVHSQKVGGFSALVNGKPNVKLFSGVLDYSLESEKLYSAWESERAISRKAYFSKNGYDYTTAVINVKFKFARHDFVNIGGIYVRENYSVSDAFCDCAETVERDDGTRLLVAIKTYRALESEPLDQDALGEYFDYDSENNWYIRRQDADKKTVPFAAVEDRRSLRETLYRDGFDCDGVHYVRYKRSAGSSRTGQCLFIAEPLYKRMMKWSLCGLNVSSKDDIDLASFEAYVSLSLSSITDKIRISGDSILFMKDAKSIFKASAVSVESDESGRLTSSMRDVEIENTIWDGEALLDSSAFEEAGYANKGMMLLRNRFFKTCAFNTNLQKYFADNGICDVSELCGYTRAKKVTDIKMIVTESSLKYLKLSDRKHFEKSVDDWLDNVDDTFGIVKTDKPTGFFDGRVVRTSYQLLNTLGLSRDEAAELLGETLEYYNNIRSSPMYMRNYINYTLDDHEEMIEEGNGYFNARQKAVLGCLSRNDDFSHTAAYKDFRSSVLSSFSRKIRSGRLLIKGTNATIFGNGLELLAASVGKYREGDGAIALGGEGRIYCKRFSDGESLLGCRSPHVTMGNLMCADNVRVDLIDKYFNLTDEIVYVNAIGCNIQQRLNGCDYDSDAMLLTNNEFIVRAAKRNSHFAVPVCSIASTRKEYADTPEGKAELDYEISQNKIGEIINLSQLLNTLYWHGSVNYPDRADESETLYRDICILAVLSGMEIDKAKRNYDVATLSVLRELKARYRIEKTPEFFKFIMYTLEKKKFKGEAFSYDTTMDYILSLTRRFINTLPKDKMGELSLACFIERLEERGVKIKSESNDTRDCEYLKRYVRECYIKISELRKKISGLDVDEKYWVQEEIESIYRDAICYVGEKLKNYYMLKHLLVEIDQSFSAKDTDEKRFYWILFEMLCLEGESFYYDIMSCTRATDMYNLVPDESGNIEIYGIKHSEKLSKYARI